MREREAQNKYTFSTHVLFNVVFSSSPCFYIFLFPPDLVGVSWDVWFFFFRRIVTIVATNIQGSI